MKLQLNLIASAFIGLAGILTMQSANAIPAFAAKYDKKCSSCHTAWPQLNAKGRAFKEEGYRLESEIREGTESVIEAESLRSMISIFLTARPYDKQDSGDTQLRAIQEAELFVAGAIDDNFSGFLAFEAEDDEDAFNVAVATATVAYRFNTEFNLNFSYAQVFEADPYSFLRNTLRLTRNRPATIDQRFGGSDRIRDNRQQVTATGRISHKLFYSLSYTGAPKDSVGEDPQGIAARVAYDITKDFMVGAFYWSGEELLTDAGSTPPSVTEFDRTGFDFQLDAANTRISGGYIIANDETLSTPGEKENIAMSFQAFHTMRSKSGKPTWVPLIRYDSYEKNDGNDQFNELTLNVGYYFRENAKGFIEYWQQLDTPDGVFEDSRLTLQMKVGF